MIEKTVRRAYRLANAEDQFSYVLHGEGHRLLWPPARGFFRQHLSAV
jgi:hypothetical protein